MKRIAVFVTFIIMLILLIPVVILGAVGPGLKVPGIISAAAEGGTGVKKGSNSYEDLKIRVYIDGDDKIVEMNLEEYVLGVVSAEMPALFEIEALKAQAVAARTYAYAKMSASGGTGCSKHKDADVCNDVHCQAWMTKEDRFKGWDASQAETLWEKLETAVSTTAGMVLIYDGQIARTIQYHAVSGGRTEDSMDVFGKAVPYLTSVESPGEEESPSYTSTVNLSASDFVDRVKKLNDSVVIDSDKSLNDQICIRDLTAGGRVKTINIGDKSFSGTDIRWAMGLKSSDFTVSAADDSVEFKVKGYGHGLGMSQWGARQMAKEGRTYDYILKHYYHGVEIKKINEIN